MATIPAVVTSVTVFCLFLFSCAHSSSSDGWRSNCKLLKNPKIAPFLYYSQSNIVVLAMYSGQHHKIKKEFDAGKKVSFIITPVCWVKGFLPGMDVTVESGHQKCGITPLSSLIEYPSLFFLRKQKDGKKWTLLNSGEYQHQVDVSGLLFGVPRSAEKFPQLCGLQNRRLAVDSKCEKQECLSYCNYNLAPPNDCLKVDQVLEKYMAKSEIPKEVPPTVKEMTPVPYKPVSGTGSGGGKGKGTMEEEKDPDNGGAMDHCNFPFVFLITLYTLLTLL